MIQTVSRKRIEILVDTPLVPRVVAQLKAVDISGWSVIHVDSGGGRAGGGQWAFHPLGCPHSGVRRRFGGRDCAGYVAVSGPAVGI